jgi:thermitase
MPRTLIRFAPWAVIALIPFSGLAEAGRRPRVAGPPFLDGQVLVGFQPGSSASDQADAHRQAGGRSRQALTRIGVEVVDVPPGGVSQAVAAYLRHPNVRFAEPNHVRLVLLPDEGSEPGPPFPLDYLAEQWGLHNTGQPLYYDPLTLQPGVITGTPDADIDAPEAWDVTTGDPAVRIAILDAGVDCQHIDLRGKCVEQRLFTSQSSTLADVIGHGTHVAGIAAAITDNGLGTAGVGFNSTVGSLKVCYELNLFPFGLVGVCDSAASAQAMIYAADNGYKVVNMSYAGPVFNQTEADAAAYAAAHGVVLVAAAANNYEATPMYPAAYPGVIAVAASDFYDNLAGFSNFGKAWVSLLAPGHNIFSAMPYSLCGIAADDPLGCYGWLSGTSMASPHVAGAAALVWARRGSGATAQQVRADLEAGADTAGALGQNFLAWTKHGRLNLRGAVTAGGPPPPPPAADVHVGDLDGAATDQGNRWSATVTIAVHGGDHDSAEGNVTVTGTWSGGGTASASCLTPAGGTCSVSRQVRRNVAAVTFTVTGLGGAPYTPAANHDPDGDSNGTTITVARPATAATRDGSSDRSSGTTQDTSARP